MKEKVTYLDGSIVDLEVNRIGFRRANQIAKKHIPINNLTINKDSNDINIKGDIDLFGMAESCLETIEGLDLEKIDSAEARRLYSKYFEKDVMAGLGQGGNPN